MDNLKGENFSGNDLEESSSEGERQACSERFDMPKGSVSSDEPVGEDFWKGMHITEKKAVRRSRRRIKLEVLAAIIFFAAGFCSAVISARGHGWIASLVKGEEHTSYTVSLEERPETEQPEKDEQGRYTKEGIAQLCSDSVVNIWVYKQEQLKTQAVGQGSGIIVTENGYIVTNAHVIDSEESLIRVIVSDEKKYFGKVIGIDEQSDIAVIKIEAKNLKAAVFGDSDQAKVGEEVVAIGNPAGYRNSVTGGIISGVDRTVQLENIGIISGCIQIDAAINPGNSGGALFNMWGQVIGITSSKLSYEDYYGVGFVISSKQAKPIIERLMEQGS